MLCGPARLKPYMMKSCEVISWARTPAHSVALNMRPGASSEGTCSTYVLHSWRCMGLNPTQQPAQERNRHCCHIATHLPFPVDVSVLLQVPTCLQR